MVLLLVAVLVGCDESSATDPPPPEAPATAATVDLSLTRDDVDCSVEVVGEEFTTVHVVVDGVLGSPCLGEPDPALLDAWEALAVIAPVSARADLGQFGGFVGLDDGEEVTLAFVLAIEGGDLFQMAVNLDEFDADPAESLVTLAHEFSHVLTQLPSQIDRTPEAAESCDTYDNGEGCFVDDSLMAQWIDEFWSDDLLAGIDPTDPTLESGADRCDLNAGFLGPYAASNPEEDFAETFGAFVYEVETDRALDDKLAWMADQPGLAEFRARAVAAGLTPIDYEFGDCG